MKTLVAWLVAAGAALAQNTPKPETPAPQDLSRDQIFEADIKDSVEKLGSDDYEISSHAKTELVQVGKRATKSLIEALKANQGDDEKKTRTRYLICEILGDIHDESSVDALIDGLKDRGSFGGEWVAVAAVSSLEKFSADRAVQPLIDVLKSDNVKINKLLKSMCINTLGNLRAKEAEELLIKALEDKGLTREDESDHQQARLIAALAAEALGKIRSKAALNDLHKLVGDTTKDPLTDDDLGRFAVLASARIRGQQMKATDDPKKWYEEQEKFAKGEKDRLDKEKKRQEAKEKAEKTKATITRLAEAIEKYKGKNNKYPKELKELQPDFWPPAPAGDFNDTWGKPIAYKEPGTAGHPFDLVSYGQDGRAGGVDENLDVWNHDDWKKVAREATIKTLKETADAIEKFNKDQGRYPITLTELYIKPASAKVWPDKGYLASMPEDAFSNALLYKTPGKDGKPFDLISYGNDRVEGGTDIDADISLWSTDWKPPQK